MKINIITQPLFSNYGGILQNYALQEVLRRFGHEPLTINVPPRDVRKREWKDYVKSVRNLISRLQGNYASPFLNPHTFAVKERELSFPQREFINRYINKIDIKAPFNPEIEAECPADLWIVGSDQVWRPWCNRYIENEFFDFLDDNTPRIAYAASFGTDKWEIPKDKIPRIKDLAKKFKAISVREKSGVRLCKDYLDVEAVHVLDPTMLLKAEDYLKHTKETDYPQGEYIAAYILDINPRKTKALKEISKEKGLNIQNVGQMRKDRYDSVESWLATIANAQYVVTDSFHGTVFSILFNRPVKILGNNLRGNTRIESLLSSLSLERDEECLVKLKESDKERLKELRSASLSFLKRQLNG